MIPRVTKGDEASATAKALSITGRATNIVGGPATGYRVTALPRAGSGSWGELPTVMTDKNGTFLFRGLPDGPCDVAATSTPLTNHPRPCWRFCDKCHRMYVVTAKGTDAYNLVGSFLPDPKDPGRLDKAWKALAKTIESGEYKTPQSFR